MEKTVSIVIPVYNVVQYLDQCIESVVNQTYNKLEILLIDDGSNDGSEKRCDELSQNDSRINVFHKHNGGLSSARNYGLRKANGEYVYFLDSDDYIEINTIETLMIEATIHNLDMITFCGECFSDDCAYNSEIKLHKRTYKKSEEKYCISSGAELYIKLQDNHEYYPAVPMHFYKRKFLNSYDLNFKEGILHEDELFSTLAYYFASNVKCCNKIFYHRRIRKNSIMSEQISIKNVDSCAIILDELEKILKIKHDDKKQSEMIKIGYAHCLWLYFIRYNKLNKLDRKKLKLSYKTLLEALKNNSYYEADEIRRTTKKRILIPLRNNKIIYKIFNVIRSRLQHYAYR